MIKSVQNIEVVGRCLEDIHVFITYSDSTTSILSAKLFADIRPLHIKGFIGQSCYIDRIRIYDPELVKLPEPMSIETIKSVQNAIKERYGKSPVSCSTCF